MFEEAPDQADLISNEIRMLSAELDSVWTCFVVGKSPLSTSPIRDQIIVSHSQKTVAPGPGPISTSIDKESGQCDASDGVALQREPHRGLPADTVPPHPPSNEVPC